MSRLSIYLFLFLILSACYKRKTGDQAISRTKPLEETKKVNTYTKATLNPEEEKTNFIAYDSLRKNISLKRIKIISSEKVIDTTRISYAKYCNDCENWNLSKQDIQEVISLSDTLDATTKNYFFLDLPCTYKGYLSIGDKIENKKYYLNAGASGVIVLSKGNYVYFGYSGTKKFITYMSNGIED